MMLRLVSSFYSHAIPTKISILIGTFLLTIGLYHIASHNTLHAVPRPTTGILYETVDLQARIQWKDREYTFQHPIKVQPEKLKDNETAEFLNQIRDRVADQMMGKNPSLDQISSTLNLVNQDTETGIPIYWKSSNEEIIDPIGNVWLLELSERTPITLTAIVRWENEETSWIFPVVVDPAPLNETSGHQKEYLEKMELDHQLQKLIQTLEQDTNGADLILPSSLPGNATIQWTKPSSSYYFWLLVPGSLILWKYSKNKKSVTNGIRRKEAILRDFPDLVSKLVLLLNAGLVVPAALEKIANDDEKLSVIPNRRPLYAELSAMQKNIKIARSPLVYELQQLGMRSGLLELNRFAAILSDHLVKGSSLTDKLEAEQRLIWFQRKKAAEEKGRVADTRMVLPMLLQLIVVLLISIAPVMMKME